MNTRTPALLLAWLALTQLSGCALNPRDSGHAAGARAADHALAVVGSPYRYGGNSPSGFDCSGLVQYSYARAGVRLPHGTEHLWRYSRTVSARELRRGDLVFFDQQGKKSSHVGIYLGRDQFVHAPSSGKQVHVASLANPYWRRYFSAARRLDAD